MASDGALRARVAVDVQADEQDGTEAVGFRAEALDASGSVLPGQSSFASSDGAVFVVTVRDLPEQPTALRLSDLFLRVLHPASLTSSEPSALVGGGMLAEGSTDPVASVIGVRDTGEAWEIALLVPPSGDPIQLLAPLGAVLTPPDGPALTSERPQVASSGTGFGSVLVFPYGAGVTLQGSEVTLSGDTWEATHAAPVNAPIPASCFD